MAFTAPTVTDIEQAERAAESSPTTKPTNIKDCDAETHDHSTSSPISEPQTAPAASPQDHTRNAVGQNKQKKNRPPVIALAGKSGVGKSTMINNVLGLEGEQRCATGDDADPTTREVKICSSTRHDTEITIVDTPGLGGLKRSEVKKILKNISKSTEETADILLYCISLHPSGRIGAADVEIISTLTKAYGPEIWSRTILALTFANERSRLTEEAYKRLIEGYARNFQSALRQANIFDVQVRSILAEEVLKGTIPAVPIGDDPSTPLVVGDDWTYALLREVSKRTDYETAIKLLKFRGYLLPATEVGGCIMAGIAVGTAVGTAAGAPVGVIPGIVVGVPAGAVAGGAIGLGIHRLVPWLHCKYLSRKADKEEGKREAAKREREGANTEGNGVTT